LSITGFKDTPKWKEKYAKCSVELPNPEECDATDDDSSTGAGLQNRLLRRP